MASDYKTAEEQFNIHEVNVSVPWGVVSAKCWGDPHSEPVLVVHGIQDNAGSFDRLIPMLPRSYYYVCMELPGHGRSSQTPTGFELTIMQCINTINRFVRHFTWRKFIYMGHSLGGQIGVYYSAMYPEQVIKLITLDTLPMFAVSKSEFLQHYKTTTEKLINLEEKMKNSRPPSYTYEEAVNKLIDQRPSPINREAAEALVKRMLVKGENGFYFSTDQRLKFGVRLPLPVKQNVYNVSRVECPYLNILTKLTHISAESEEINGSSKSVLKTFEKMKNVLIVIVDGYHDVHNNKPQVVAPYINKFLVHTKSLL